MNTDIEALIVVSFGGPEKPDDVMPFLENVTRGRGIPRERLLEVAEHYHHFGGRSPINDQNRELIAALREQVDVPVYWGNRNWDPFLADTVRQMRDDGIRHAAAFITSAFGSYSGCRQYREDIARATAAVENAPELRPLPLFYMHPLFVSAMTDRVKSAIDQFDSPPQVVFTAHSIPMSMASTSPYVGQLNETCSAIAERLGLQDWKLVYQSRSGPPTQPWLEPDILDYIRDFDRKELVIAPVGFISDHMEVLYDLDTEAAALCSEFDIRMVRAGTVGTHPAFVRMIVELAGSTRTCAPDCCPPPQRPSARPAPPTVQPGS